MLTIDMPDFKGFLLSYLHNMQKKYPDENFQQITYENYEELNSERPS